MAHRTPGPEKNRFAYAESPAKQRHDRELPDTAHNPNELGRIRILLPVVCFCCFWGVFLWCFLVFFLLCFSRDSAKKIWFFFFGAGMSKTGNSRSACASPALR